MKKQHIILILIVNLLIISITVKTNIFGSTMDFLNQHIVFPEYLRNMFYETGKFIPKLAVNIGSGENIYNIAYYGLLNPIILISYLFPFIKMSYYIIFTNIILLMLSDILFYKLMTTKFDSKIALFLSLLFSLSGPLIFQFHRHFMFVNYMPFLILGFIHIDKCKQINLIIDIFLIIMTSFYYSIPSIIVLIIYYIYNFKFKKFFEFIMCIFTSIMCSMVLLLPTFGAIINTRSTSSSVNILSLLIPNFNIDNILYGAYCPGLTSICLISLIYLLIKKGKNNLFLFISLYIIFFVPLFLYLLNGGLYIRSKILIPFLPLLILIIGIFVKDLFYDKVNLKKLILYIFIFNLIVLIKYHVLVYYIDLLFTIILLITYSKTKNKKVLAIPIIILNLIICISLNNTEKFASYDLLETDSKVMDTFNRTINLNDTNYTINKVYGNTYYTTSIYSSTENKYYSNLYHNTFKVNNSYINNLEIGATSNVLFNTYLGVKYIISDNDLSYPYLKIDANLYELNVNSIGYVTSNKVNSTYFKSLEYPYNLDILLNYIVDDSSNNKPKSNIKKVSLDYDYKLGNNIVVDGNVINVLKEDNIIINLKDNLENKILFINIYGLEENDNDISMTINGQTNLLTSKDWLYHNNNNNFYFCLNNVSDKLNITLTPGKYKIDKIETFILDDITLLDVDNFNITKMNSEIISGNIVVNNDGTFILKIPYDKGFTIKVNDNIVDYKLINDTFIGFDLNKGIYNIEITYSPPYLKVGKILSLIGLILFGIEIFYVKKVPDKVLST